jgi:hypothetical protein
MNEKTKNFLNEFADLLDKYDVEEFEVEEECVGYACIVEGIEVYIPPKYDEDGNPKWDDATVLLPKCFDANDLRELAKEQ